MGTYLIDTTQTKFDSMDSEINPVLNFDPPTELDTTQPGFIPSEDNEETRLQYDHVIIGAGKAGTAAVTVLKQVREGDSVLMVGGMKTPRINRLCDSKDELNGLLVERVTGLRRKKKKIQIASGVRRRLSHGLLPPSILE